MALSSEHRVALAAVDFQNDVRVWGALPEALATYLRTEVFPVNGPPSLRSASGYDGMKLFVYRARYLCLARFFDGQKTDAYQRAIPSARVLVLDRDGRRKGFRNLLALNDFLADAAFEARTFEAHREALNTLFDRADMTGTEAQFEVFIRAHAGAYDRVVTAMGLLVSTGRLTLCCPTRARGLAFLATLFALAPFDLLEATTWCSYVDALSGPREAVVSHRCTLVPPEPASWLDKLRGRFKSDAETADVRLDIASGVLQGVRAKGPRRQRVEQIVRELSENTLQLPLSFEARFQLFVELLGALYRDDAPAIDRVLADRLANPGVRDTLKVFLQQT